MRGSFLAVYEVVWVCYDGFTGKCLNIGQADKRMRRRNRLMCMALAVMMWMMLPGFASADDLDFLKPIWLNALENMQEQKYAGGERIVYEEPKVVSEAPELEVVRSGVYMNNEYESEAYVYAQVKNITEETIRISSIALTVYDANGKTLDKREYASCVPTVILPGETAYVKEWFYDFVRDVSQVRKFGLGMEPASYSRKQISAQLQTEVSLQGEYLVTQVTNTTDDVQYEVEITAALSNSDGRLLDVAQEYTGSIGIMPGSTIAVRRRLADHAFRAADGEVCFDAAAYAYSD